MTQFCVQSANALYTATQHQAVDCYYSPLGYLRLHKLTRGSLLRLRISYEYKMNDFLKDVVDFAKMLATNTRLIYPLSATSTSQNPSKKKFKIS